MKILVMPKPIEGVSREEMLQHAAAEIQAVWEESASVEAAKEALATLPFAQLHLIDFDVIPLAPFTGLARLFQAPTGEPTQKTN